MGKRKYPTLGGAGFCAVLRDADLRLTVRCQRSTSGGCLRRGVYYCVLFDTDGHPLRVVAESCPHGNEGNSCIHPCVRVIDLLILLQTVYHTAETSTSVRVLLDCTA